MTSPPRGGSDATAAPGGAVVPIACDLDAESLSARVGEWRALVASEVDSVEASTTSVRLGLHDTEGALVAAASLGQREKRCCAFFDVSIQIDSGQRALVLSVPAGAEGALAAFVAMLTG
jgi:hypothetical protein